MLLSLALCLPVFPFFFFFASLSPNPLQNSKETELKMNAKTVKTNTDSRHIAYV